MKTSIIILCLITLLGCEQSPTPDAKKQSVLPLQKISVAYTNQPQNILIHVAVAKGYFVEEGLEVQPLMFTFGKAALESLIAHKSDFATVASNAIYV